MIEWTKDFWPLCVVVLAYFWRLERKLIRLEIVQVLVAEKLGINPIDIKRKKKGGG